MANLFHSKEDIEKLKQQLAYFREKIDDLRERIIPHLKCHTVMDTEECKQEQKEYDIQLQKKFEELDRALNAISFTLGKRWLDKSQTS
jgi:hypothetical protein